MPQLDFANPLMLSKLVWMLIIFGLLFYILKTYALPEVASVLDERAARIAADLDAARDAQAAGEAAMHPVMHVVGARDGDSATRRLVVDHQAGSALRYQAPDGVGRFHSPRPKCRRGQLAWQRRQLRSPAGRSQRTAARAARPRRARRRGTLRRRPARPLLPPPAMAGRGGDDALAFVEPDGLGSWPAFWPPARRDEGAGHAPSRTLSSTCRSAAAGRAPMSRTASAPSRKTMKVGRPRTP